MPLVLGIAALCLLAGITFVAWHAARSKGIDRFVLPYVRDAARRVPPPPGEPVHVLICVADHYEPGFGGADDELARQRVERWATEYPRQFGRFRDTDGRTPRHTFFYPPEHYTPEYLDRLAGLCRDGFGEVEIHLHHHDDTADTLREKLVRFRDMLVDRHSLLARDKATGAVRWGFVHGDWALDNSRPDGKCCGVNNELTVLRETGCYADFTFPSAPHPTQPRKINSIYYAIDDPVRPRSHDTGIDVGAGPAPRDGFMLIQGPLLFDWRRRKFGVVPRIENGYLQRGQNPSPRRLDLWLRAGVTIRPRPDWRFVKLHCHGATEWHSEVLLGPSMVALHEELARRAAADRHFHLHYVTAREMYNLARAAEAGWSGSVDQARDFELEWNGGASGGRQMTAPASLSQLTRLNA